MKKAASRRAAFRYDRVGLTVREGKGPREQILEEGAESLSDRELVAAVLGTGCLGTPVTELAEIVLKEASLEALARSSPRELRRIRGLGTARACQLLAAFEIGRRAFGRAGTVEHPIRTPQDLLPLVHHYAAARKEHFLAVLLNTRHLPISVEVISVGSLNASIVHPREVFRPAITATAASIILAHNHPSGDATPSEDDLEITQRLCRVGEMAGIEVLDHIILGSGPPFSFKEAGLI
jgi:DNA repair protein RadC